jgi:hypothetical protein
MATLAQWKEQIKAENPSLTKMVDGDSIALTTAEYEKTINEWAQNAYNQQQENDVKENGGASANYAQFRIEAYGSISNQLDMQYWDAVNGTTVWQDHITAVKAKYPKP